MALLWLDSVDSYDSAAQVPQKWTSVVAGDHALTVAAEGRNANCLKWVTTTNVGTLEGLTYAPVSIGTTSEGVFGFALKFTNLGNLAAEPGNRILFAIDGAHGYSHLTVSLNTNGTLSVYRNNAVGDTLLGASTQAVREAEWVYLEFDWKIHHTLGTFTIYVNGVTTEPAYEFGPGDTCANGTFGQSLTTQWTGIRLFSGGYYASGALKNLDTYALTVRTDDHYLLDKTDSGISGASNDAAWGGVTLGFIVPDAGGTTTQWDRAGTDSGNNWDQVEEVGPDTTDRIETDVVGEIDTYLHTDVGASVVVKGVQLVAYCQKGDSGTNTLAGTIRSNGVNYFTAERGIASNLEYTYACFPSDGNPDGDVAWTPTTVNLAEFGPKKTA